MLPVPRVLGPRFLLQTSYLPVAENGKFDKTSELRASPLSHTESGQAHFHTLTRLVTFDQSSSSPSQLPPRGSPVVTNQEYIHLLQRLQQVTEISLVVRLEEPTYFLWRQESPT